MFHVVWYEGWSENIHSFDTHEQAAQFILDTGMDPDEFDITEGHFPDV
jgi:hypothetical protein